MSKLSVLPENWHTKYLKDANSYSKKSQSCLFYMKTGTHTQYLEDADSYFDISFLKFQT